MSPFRGTPLSIRVRLVIAAACVLVAFLSLTGSVLDQAFRSSVEDAAREQLRIRALNLLGIAELVDGVLSLPPVLPEAGYDHPGSGLHARLLDAGGNELWTSRSFVASVQGELGEVGIEPGRHVFLALESAEPAVYRYGLGVLWEGPTGEADASYTLWVTMAQAPFLAETTAFRRTLYLLLGGAGIALLLVLLGVVAIALEPLRRVAQAVEAIEKGTAERLDGVWPREISGLARNLNLLIDHERGRQQRYRNTLGDLAHSLKTPLAVLRNALAAPATAEAAEAREQVDRMESIVTRQLQRASVARNPLSRALTSLAPHVERVASGLRRLHAEQGIEIGTQVEENAVVAMDERDLYEILGNLMENACKHGGSRVLVRAWSEGETVAVSVEDDGPGVPESLRSFVLERGARADTATSGQGLGLALVAELVAAHDGSVQIAASDLGGAAVVVRLGAGQAESVTASSDSSSPSGEKLPRHSMGRQQTLQSS